MAEEIQDPKNPEDLESENENDPTSFGNQTFADLANQNDDASDESLQSKGNFADQENGETDGDAENGGSFQAGYGQLQEAQNADETGTNQSEEENGVKPLQDFSESQPGTVSEDPFDQAMELVKKGDAGTLVDDFNPHDKDYSENLKSLLHIKFDLILEIGRARMKISDILLLGQGSVIELNKLVGDELNIMVNDKWIARGEIVICRERFGTRITHILSQEERLKKLGTFF